jgi:cytidyltransferase-like protein
MVDGSFDPLHPGHLAYFRAARSLGYPLLCNICPDRETAKKHPILLPAADRAQILAHLDILQYVHVSDRPTVDVLRQLQPAFYVKGMDWKDRLPVEQGQVCDELGIRIRFTDSILESSSRLLAKFQPDVEAFEQLVQGQQSAREPWAPVTDYSFEARKAIEGKHPDLIREVFQPKRALDAGCGPVAHLVEMLVDRGVDAWGCDTQPPSGQRFFRCDIADANHLGRLHRSSDLVICREVLEHMTVRQIRQAVVTLCAFSSRFVYATTRFTQARHFLDFATSDDLDPTHISIMPQDWLRHLFVLEGFTRRADLEQRMDWQNKSRVLVYERVA